MPYLVDPHYNRFFFDFLPLIHMSTTSIVTWWENSLTHVITWSTIGASSPCFRNKTIRFCILVIELLNFDRTQFLRGNMWHCVTWSMLSWRMSLVKSCASATELDLMVILSCLVVISNASVIFTSVVVLFLSRSVGGSIVFRSGLGLLIRLDYGT